MSLNINQREKYLGLTLDGLKSQVRIYYPEKMIGVFSSNNHQPKEMTIQENSLCLEWRDGEDYRIAIINVDGTIYLHALHYDGETNKSTTIRKTKENLDEGNYSLIEEWFNGNLYTIQEYIKLKGGENNRNNFNSSGNAYEYSDGGGEKISEKKINAVGSLPSTVVNLEDYKNAKPVTDNVIPLHPKK